MPGNYNLTNLWRGDSYSWRFLLYDDDERTIPTDLAGATVAAEIREKSAGSSVVKLACTVTEPNIIDMDLTPGMYVTCPSKGVWDLQVSFPGGRVRTRLEGTVSVKGDVTDSVAMVAR